MSSPRRGRWRRSASRATSSCCICRQRTDHGSRPQIANTSLVNPQVTFIAPLDPFVWDRGIIRDLFGFDYLWEVYVPGHKRRWGYYVLPILFGDRIVGRIEPRLDRAARTLRILGIWWEKGFSPRAAEGFVRSMRAALGDYLEFVGASTLEWAPATGSANRLFGTVRRRPG